MTENTGMLRAGVAGWPVSHSRSPLIHEHWLRELGIAGRYERFAVPPGRFAEFAAGIGRNGLIGVNVTVPHKEAAFASCGKLTQVAKALGAVNTLWREGADLCGDNTDVRGFLENIDEEAEAWAQRSQSAVVIGAGGAARAVVYALRSRGFQRVAIVNRTQARAIGLAEQFAPMAIAARWSALAEELRQADVLVNASSLGMAGQPPLEISLANLPERAVVADVVYVPLRTPLIEAARLRGIRAVEGLGMLLHQAVPAFERWFGRRPEVTSALRALVEADVLRPQSIEQ